MGLLVANVDTFQWGCFHLCQLQWFLKPYQIQIMNRTRLSLQLLHSPNQPALMDVPFKPVSRQSFSCSLRRINYRLQSLGVPHYEVSQYRASGHGRKQQFISKILGCYNLMRMVNIVAKSHINNQRVQVPKAPQRSMNSPVLGGITSVQPNA